MNKTIEESKCLASLAVFRELYNSEKDIYGIISEFIVELIVSTSKHSFNLTEITASLNKEYDFSIPEAVVKSSLNRLKFLSKNQGIYIVDNLKTVKSNNLNLKKESIQKSNEDIIDELFKFIEQHTKKTLDDTEKTNVVHSFISFIIDNSNGNNYSEFISAYIISKKDDLPFKEQLSTIKEGVVLYSGIKYNNNINDLGSWKTDLTIFIETEILFHFAGFNGEIYQKLWQDFFNYVKEINRNHPNRIKLRYFNDVNSEIERFFKKAEYIVDGDDKANPEATAMTSIINGCETKADVVSKKAQFFQNLKKSNIREEEFNDYFDEKYHQYNIVDQSVINKVSEELEIEDPTKYLKFLNYVSIHRKEANENNFENVGYILLSGNSKTLQIAWNDNIKIYGYVPLATTLSFLTNKFWFKLNKGFGKANFPLTFDVITKAQIVLSNQINESVGLQYDELQNKFKLGEINEDQARASIIELRKQAKNPEDIRKEEITNILDSISEKSIESYLKEQEYFKVQAESEALENTILKGDLTKKEAQVEKYSNKQKALNTELLAAKNNLLKEKEKSINILTESKKPIDNEIANSIIIYKFFIAFIFVLAFGLTYFLIWKFGWNDSEKWTWILTFITPLLLTALYMLFAEKTINPLELLKRKKVSIKEDKYAKFNFNVSLLKELKKESKELKKEIKELNASTQQSV
jgi:uncharacterized membrane protein (DUF485 family)